MTELTHVLTPLLMALVAQGAYIAQQEGMILHFLTKAWGLFPRWFHKPLFTCPICMVSVWGLPTWWMFNSGNPWYIPFFLLAAAGINAVITRD